MNPQESINPQIEATVREMLIAQKTAIPIVEFGVHLLLAAMLGILLALLYTRFGTSFSNRSQFSKNFVLLTMVTMLIITIVKSSLALSLGLVGALSIVRFRAAIKDPEELVFLFIAIAIGLGMGAGQVAVTLLGFLLIAFFIVSRGLLHFGRENQDLCLSLTSEKKSGLSLEAVSEVLHRHCTAVDIKRVEEEGGVLDMAFVIAVEKFENLSKLRKDLADLGGVSRLVLLDNTGTQH